MAPLPFPRFGREVGDPALANALVAATVEAWARPPGERTDAHDALTRQLATSGADSMAPFLHRPPAPPRGWARHPQEAADWPDACRRTALHAVARLGADALPTLRAAALGADRALQRVAFGVYLSVVRDAGAPALEQLAIRGANIAGEVLIDWGGALLELFPADQKLARRVDAALELPG